MQIESIKTTTKIETELRRTYTVRLPEDAEILLLSSNRDYREPPEIVWKGVYFLPPKEILGDRVQLSFLPKELESGLITDPHASLLLEVFRHVEAIDAEFRRQFGVTTSEREETV